MPVRAIMSMSCHKCSLTSSGVGVYSAKGEGEAGNRTRRDGKGLVMMIIFQILVAAHFHAKKSPRTPEWVVHASVAPPSLHPNSRAKNYS